MTDPNLPSHVRLEDDNHIFDLQLRDGANGFREGSTSPSTLSVTGGGGKYGDFDANFSHLEQRSWHSGRGSENFVDDQTRFFDSKDLWSLTPNKLCPAPQWDFAKGIRAVDEYMPITRNLTWIPLIGVNRFQDISYVGASSYSADKVSFFIRRKGSPGTLTQEQCPDSAGDPGVANKTVTKTTSDITDTVGDFQEFNWTTTTAQTSGVTYHVKVYGAAADSIENCWELGVDTGTTGGKSSTAGSVWVSAAWKPFFRVTDASNSKTFLMFYLEGGTYALVQNANLSSSVLYINGDRGTASAGATTTLTNSSRTWVVNQWAGARVKVIGGTGVGLNARIASNTSTVLTFETADTLPYALDNTSRYVIYKTPYWTTASIGTTGLGAVYSVAVINNIAYFAQGAGVNIRRAQSSANTHNWADDGTNRAELLRTHFDPTAGSQMWKTNKSPTTYSYAPAVAWGVSLTFGTAVPVGSADYLITGLEPFNNQMMVLKEDSLWAAQQSRVAQVNIGINGLPWGKNGSASATSGAFLYFNFWRSLERMLGGTVDDVGPQKDAGLPALRSGPVSSLQGLLVWLFASINAGILGTSSVMIFQDRGYHEVLRAPTLYPVTSMFAQANDDTLPYLWTAINGDLVYQEYSLDPIHESGFRFQHEAVMVSSTFDMGHTETYKFFEELSADTENLNKNNINIGVDFQSGSEVNTSTWHPLSGFYESPKDSAKILAGETTKMRFRLRLNTNVATTPPIVNGTVLKGFEVTPAKRVWNLTVQASSILSGANHVDPDVLYRWLRDAKNKAVKVRMTTVFPDLRTAESIYVKVEPPTVTREFINRQAKWVGSFYLTLREI